MSNIPNVEEFLEKENLPDSVSGGTLKFAMIEFAKLHVEAALKAAAKNAEITNKAKFEGDYNPIVDEESILNSYPLDNIK